MEQRIVAIGFGLFGAGLLAASMVGVLWLTRPDVTPLPSQPGSVDWAPLARLEGRAVKTGGVEFAVEQVLLGDAVNPILRGPALGGCEELVVLRLRVQNQGPGSVQVTPGLFHLLTGKYRGARQTHLLGFEARRLAPGEARAYEVGFVGTTATLPCILLIRGDALREPAGEGDEHFDGVLDVCPGGP